jgi:hypothetical protein
MEARAGGAVHWLALEWSGPAFAKLRRGEGWNRLELAKSGASRADVSVEAASGDSSAVKGLRALAATFPAWCASPWQWSPVAGGQFVAGHGRHIGHF